MRIQVNGRDQDLGPSKSIAELLADMGLEEDPVAVAVNREVIPRAEHISKQLAEGDQVEIIQAVAGG